MIFVVSKARPGFFNTFSVIFYNILNPFLPKFLKKSPRPLACIVLSEKVKDFSLLQNEQ